MVHTMRYEEFSEKYFKMNVDTGVIPKMEVKYSETFSPLFLNLSVPRFAVLHKDFIS